MEELVQPSLASGQPQETVEQPELSQSNPEPQEGPPIKVRQSDLNDFHETLKKYPDYTFEEAIVDFPEIAENESLWESYQIYSNTINAGKYSPEELNAKFIEATGFEIEANAGVIKYEYQSPGGMVDSEQPPSQEPPVETIPGKIDAVNQQYPEVPIVKRANFLNKIAEEPKPKEQKTQSEDPVDNDFSKYFKPNSTVVSGGDLGENFSQKAQEAKQERDVFTQFQYQSRKDAYADINASYEQLVADAKSKNPNITEAEAYYQAVNRKAEAIRVANQEYELKYGSQDKIPTAPKELIEIIDAYDKALEESGATGYGKAYKAELVSYDQWMSSPADSQLEALGVQSNAQAIELRKTINEQLSPLITQYNELAKTLKEMRSGADAGSQESVDAYNELWAQADGVYSQIQSLEQQNEKLNPVIEQYALKVENMQNLFLEYEKAKSSVPEELRLKGPIAIAQYENASSNFNQYIASRQGSVEDFNNRIRDIRQGVSTLESIKNVPQEEIGELDIQYANLNKLLSQTKVKISALESSAKEMLASLPAGYSPVNVAKYVVSKQADVPAELREWVAKASPLFNQLKNLKTQLKSTQQNLDVNRERFHMWTDVQKTINDPEWKQKARLDKFNKQSFLGKASIIAGDAVQQAGYSLQKTWYAMEDLAWSTASGMYEVLGNEKAAKSFSAFNSAYIDAVVGDIDENLKYIQELSPMSSVQYLESKGIENLETKSLELFAITAQAGASIATSMAGTLLSGGNPYVGGAIGFAQVFGDSYFEAMEQGLNKSQSALFASILGLAAATSDTYAFGGMLKRLQSEGRESLRRTLWKAIQDNGGSLKGLNYGAIASSHLKGMVPGLLEEPASEVWEGLVGTATEFAFSAAGTDIETVESIDEFLGQVKENAIGGLAGAVLMAIPGAYKSMVSPKFSALVHGMVFGEDGQKNEEFIRAELDRYLETGRMSQLDYDKTIRRIDSLKDLYQSEAIPKSITNQDAVIQAIALVQEKNELEDSVKKYGKSLAAKELQRIGEIDAMLNKISLSNKTVQERSIMEREGSEELGDPYMEIAKAIYAGEEIDIAEVAKRQAAKEEPISIEPVQEGEALGAEPQQVAPVEEAKAEKQKAPRKASQKKPSVPKFKPKRVFPKRPKPKAQEFTTPQGIPVTATPEAQDEFSNTTIESAPYRAGVYVNYQGIEGSLQMTEDGLPAVKTSNGEYYVIEGAIPGRTMGEIGIELVRDFDTMEAMTPTELAAIEVSQETDASAVEADFSTNTVKVYGGDYDYVSVNVDGEGDVVSVNLRDKATGQEVTVRNENLLYAIEEQKIRYELEQSGVKNLTASDVQVAAEQLNIKPKDEKPAKATPQRGGERAVQVQPQGETATPAVNQREQGQVASPLGNAKEVEAKVMQAAEGVDIAESIKAPMVAAIATAFKSPLSAKKFIRNTGKRPKQIIQNLTGIDMNQDADAIDAQIDDFFNQQVPAQTSEVSFGNPTFNPDNPEAKSYPIRINNKYAGVISVNNDGYISSSIGMAGVELIEEFQGKGYGAKVYLALANELSKEGKTLKSEFFGKSNINPQAKSVWNSLINKGLAVDRGEYFEVILPQQNEAQTIKTTTNAIQEQAAGQVPVQSEAQISQEVAQGAPQAEPQVPAQEVKVQEVTPQAAPVEPVATAQQEPTPEQKSKRERRKAFSDKVAASNKRNSDMDLEQAAPKEQVQKAKKRIPRIKELYNVARGMYGRTRPQAFVEALIMDRLIQSRAKMLGIKPSDLYKRMTFKTEGTKLPENRVNFQMEAYQGGGALFKKFDLSFVGSGEGFQAYARGLYFSGNFPTARGYAKGIHRVRVNLTDPDTDVEYENVPIEDTLRPIYMIEKISEFFNEQYLKGNISVRQSTNPQEVDDFTILYKYNGVTYELKEGEVPPGMPEIFTFSDGSTTDVFGRHLSSEDVFKILGMSIEPTTRFPESLSIMAANYEAYMLSRLDRTRDANYSENEALFAVFNLMDEVYSFDKVSAYYNIVKSIEEFGLKGPQIEIDVEEDFTDEMKEELFEEYVNAVDDADPFFIDGLNEMGIEFIDLSSYLYTATIFKGVDISDDTVMPLHKKATRKMLDGIVKFIDSKGIDKISPNALVSEQAAALSAELLKVYADDNIETAQEMSDVMRPKLEAFLDSVNEKLGAYGLELILSVPKGSESNHLYYKIIFKEPGDPAYDRFKANYKIGDVFNRSPEFVKDLENVEDFETALKKQSILTAIRVLKEPTQENITEYYKAIVKKFNSNIYGLLRGAPSTTARRSVYGKYLSEDTFSLAEVSSIKELASILGEQEAKDMLLGLSSVFGEVFPQSSEGSVVGNILMGDKFIPEINQATQDAMSVPVYKTGYGVHLAFEAMNMAETVRYQDIELSELAKSFVLLSSYFEQPKSLRLASQKKTTDAYLEMGFYGNYHPRGQGGNMGPYYKLQEMGLKSGLNQTDFNYVVFSDENVEAKRIIKWQAENQYEPEGLSATSNIIVTAMASDPGKDPVADIVSAFIPYMTEGEKAVVLNAYKQDAWGHDTSVFFRHQFMNYLATGEGPTAELIKLFEKFRQWMVDLIGTIYDADVAKLKISPEMKALFDNMLSKKPGKISVPEKLNKKINFDIKPPDLFVGSLLSSPNFGDAEVIDVDTDGRVTLSFKQSGNQAVIAPLELSQLFFLGVFNVKQTDEVTSIKNALDESSKKKTIGSKPEPTSVKKAPPRSPAAPEKAAPPATSKRIEDSRKALDSNPDTSKMLSSVKDKNGLEQVYKKLFGLSDKKAKAAAVVADRIMQTIAERTKMSKDEVYQMIKYRKTTARQLAQEQGVLYSEGAKYRGAMRFLPEAEAIIADAEAIIYALEDPNVSTPLHELAHVYEKYLTEDERAAVADWSRTTPGSVEFSEAFARGFERFLYDGGAPSSKIRQIYSGLKNWLKTIYGELSADSAIGLALNPPMKEVYSAMLRELPYQRKTPKIDNTKVAVEQISGKRGDIMFSIRAGADKIGVISYDKVKRQWVGVSSEKAGDVTDIRANSKPEVVAQMVSRHDKAIDKEYEAAGKRRPAPAPVGKGKETVVKTFPPLIPGLKIIDSAGQQYEIIKEEADSVVAKRKGTNTVKTFLKSDLAKLYADNEVSFKANRKIREAIDKIKKELEEVQKALKSKEVVALEEPQQGPVAGDIGSRGEPFTGRKAADLYKITRERVGDKSTRHVQRLPGGRILKVANDAAGMIQNMAEGIEPFSPMVLESGVDYVIVEDFGSKESTVLERFRNWVSRTRPEDWMKRPEVFVKQLQRYGIEGILDPAYSLLYGDIISPEQWGERDGKIFLLDGGSLVAGYAKDRKFDEAEEALKTKSLETKESLNSPFLYQADPADTDWDNLPNKNRRAYRKILNVAKKLIRENGNKPNGIAQLLIDVMAESFPDMTEMPKRIAFDTVINALAEMGISPDFTGMDVDADSSELSEQVLDEKTVFRRVLSSKAASPYLKRELNKIGSFYEVESKTLARDFAYAIIEEFGPRTAIAMVESGKFKGATGSWIYGLAIDKASASGARYSEVAALIDAFSKHQRALGRGISVLKDVYVSSPAGLYNLLIHAINQQNAHATTQATPTATAMSGALQGASQTAAAQVANSMTSNAPTPASTAINDLLVLGQKERMKALKQEAKSLLDSLRGISQNLPVVAPSQRIQALQNMGNFDKIVQLAGNYIKRGHVQFKIWKLNLSKGLATVGLTFNDSEYQYIWDDTQVRTILQDTLNSGLAPLDGPINDYMKSAKIKLANIVKLAAANRDLTIASLSKDIADSLSVDPAVANQLATEIEAQITAASRILQQKIVDKYMAKLRSKYGVNPDMADIALKDLIALVNNNQADPMSIASAIKFAFGGVAMTDPQADEFMRLAERVFKTRPESKNRQIVTKDVVSFVNKLHPTSFSEKFWIMFFPNQLAGISTQVVNTVGNFYNSIAQAVVYAFEDARNVARMGASYAFSDSLRNLSQQFGSAIDSAIVVMKQGIAGTGNKYADIRSALQNQKTIEDDMGHRIRPYTGLGIGPGAIQAIVNLYNGFMMANQTFLKMFPTRAMNAVDNSFFQGNFEKSIRRQTINELYEQGLRGKALRDAVNQVLYGTKFDLEETAALIKAEMDAVGIPFFNKEALSTYVAAKQFASEFKNAVRGALSLEASAPLPPAGRILEQMNQDPTTAPLLTAAAILADPKILTMTSLMTAEARAAIREYHVNTNVSESIIDRAYKQSEYLTLKNQPEGILGVFAGFTGSAVGSIPLLRFFVPYVNVPFNIANMMLDWFPITSVARAYGISVSSFVNENTLNRFNVRSTSQAETVSQRYGLEYDPVLHAEQKRRALYSTLLAVGLAIHFIGKATGDDEDEEGPAITGGLFNVKYKEAGKTQIPYRVRLFGEEFSYENTPLFLLLACIGNLCDVIREQKATINEDDSKVKAGIYNTMMAFTYTVQSFTEALPIEGLQVLTESAYKSRGTQSLSALEKGYMKTAQSVIRGLLTPVPVIGNNLVKQAELLLDPKKYLDDPYDPESFIARATGHNVINTLSDGSIVMKDYLGRDVVKLPGSRNIVSLDVAERSEIDRYIYANHFNFIPVSNKMSVSLWDDSDPNETVLTPVALVDNKELFDLAYSKGGQIMNAYLTKYIDVIKGIGDKALEKALVIEANKYQIEYVSNKISDASFENKRMPVEDDIPVDINEAFKGWGAGKPFLDGATQFDEEGSILTLLDELSAAKFPAQRLSVISELKNLLSVRSETEAQIEKFKKQAEKYNLNVNTENIRIAK